MFAVAIVLAFVVVGVIRLTDASARTSLVIVGFAAVGLGLATAVYVIWQVKRDSRPIPKAGKR